MTSRRPARFVILCGCALVLAAGQARADDDDNPPGPAGGAGTNWENRPGVAGGPGASPDLKFWSREAWDEFCVEMPARCGSRRDVGYGPNPRSLDLGGRAAQPRSTPEDAGEGESADVADSQLLPATDVRQD